MASRTAKLPAVLALFLVSQLAEAQYQRPLSNTPMSEAVRGMSWRSIGPANMGGRVTDIDGIPGDPKTYYVSGAEGGVLKTTDAGNTFEQLFADQRAFSVGALTIAPSDSRILWLGSGEGDPRNSVSYGNGVYRSEDGGKSWKHLGLENTERIKRIVVHPKDPDVAFVCAVGRAWGPNEMRGVFRTENGGRSWDKVLFIDENTGCSDLDIEHSDPKNLYAGMWTFRRKPWRFDDGGGETALYKSSDGGKSWTKLTKGLPGGPVARIGVAVAQSKPSVVYMISKATDGSVLWRSDDRGESWRLVNSSDDVNSRPFYFSDIRVDPDDPDVVYSLSFSLLKSIDGGANFERIAKGTHPDHQSLWIDPINSDRLLSGSDGGWQVSWDAGATFDIVNNVPLAQFYQISVDQRQPYNICGGLQDNGIWCGPSNSLDNRGILNRDWSMISFGDGFYAIPIPGSGGTYYLNSQGGAISRVDRNTGLSRNIHPYPNAMGTSGSSIEDHRYRFNWNSPIEASPHDSNTVYFGGNVVFRSTDRGFSWMDISPDLTTNNKSKQTTSGGDVYQENSAAEYHCTILSIKESPVEPGVIWVGTDDGRIHLTRDGGDTWKELTDRVPSLPRLAWIEKIDASPHDAATAYIAVDQHRSNDFRPHAFKTTDYGATWTRITSGLPADDYVKVVREDPVVRDVLFLGMQHGVYVSWDGGSNWSSIQNDLPPASVRDLQIHRQEHDLIIGTHGRGAWVLDDISPLARLPEAIGKKAHLFDVRDPVLWQRKYREIYTGRAFAGQNPPAGALINFHLQESPEPTILAIYDSEGEVIWSKHIEEPQVGLNRVVWPLKYGPRRPEPEEAETPLWRRSFIAPPVIPGMYTAELTVGSSRFESTFEVLPDPRISSSHSDYRAELEAALKLRDLFGVVDILHHNAGSLISQLEDLRAKLDITWVRRKHRDSAGEAKTGIDNVIEALNKYRATLRRPRPVDPFGQGPRLREGIMELVWATKHGKPSESQLLRLMELEEETEQAKARLTQLLDGQVSRINALVEDLPGIADQ